MNILDYPDDIGKIFFRNIDLMFLQDGYKEAFAGLLSGISNPELASKGIKLSGCEVIKDGNEYTLNSGYIYLKGEVLRVEAAVVNAPNYIYFDAVQTDFNTERNAPIQTGGSHPTRKQRVASLIADSSQPGDFMPYNAPSFETKIMNAANPVGHIVFYDPRLSGSVMTDHFNMVTGEGLAGKKYEDWIVLGVAAGTEDYLGRCIVSIKGSDPDLDEVGKVYGEKEHTLSGQESGVQSHSHDFERMTFLGGNGRGSGTNDLGYTSSVSEDSGYEDAEQAHNNMQPSIVAAYICRKSDDGYYMP